MMYNDINQALTQAYDLIEAEKLDEARALLEPILEREKDNADAWWLYTHAVADTETARKALQNVLRIEPDYPDARDLMKKLEDAFPAAPSPGRPIERIDARRPPADLPPTPPDLPERVAEAWEGEEQAPRRFPTPRQLAILIPLLVVIVVGGLLVILNSANLPQIAALTPATLPLTEFTPIPQDTLVPSAATEEEAPIPTVEEQPTSTLLTTSDAYETLYNALANFTVPRNAIETSETGLGSTLLVSICTIAGPELRAALPEAMNAIASASGSLAADVDAIGAKMLNCGNNTTLLVIAVPMEDAVAYANGELDDETFQALWRSQ